MLSAIIRNSLLRSKVFRETNSRMHLNRFAQTKRRLLKTDVAKESIDVANAKSSLFPPKFMAQAKLKQNLNPIAMNEEILDTNVQNITEKGEENPKVVNVQYSQGLIKSINKLLENNNLEEANLKFSELSSALLAIKYKPVKLARSIFTNDFLKTFLTSAMALKRHSEVIQIVDKVNESGILGSVCSSETGYIYINICALDSSSNWLKAKEMIFTLSKCDKIDVKCFESSILLCSSIGKWRATLDILECMLCKPSTAADLNAVMIAAIINVCKDGNSPSLPKVVFELFKTSIRRELERDINLYANTLEILMEHKFMTESEEVLKQFMKDFPHHDFHKHHSSKSTKTIIPPVEKEVLSSSSTDEVKLMNTSSINKEMSVVDLLYSYYINILFHKAELEFDNEVNREKIREKVKDDFEKMSKHGKRKNYIFKRSSSTFHRQYQNSAIPSIPAEPQKENPNADAGGIAVPGTEEIIPSSSVVSMDDTFVKYLKLGQNASLFTRLEKMNFEEKKKIRPNTWNTIFNQLMKSKLVKEAVGLLNIVRDIHVPVDKDSLATTAGASVKLHQWALKIVILLGELGLWEDLVELMNKFETNREITDEIFIKFLQSLGRCDRFDIAFESYKKFKMGELAVNSLDDKFLTSSTADYSLLRALIENNQNWEYVYEILKLNFEGDSLSDNNINPRQDEHDLFYFIVKQIGESSKFQAGNHEANLRRVLEFQGHVRIPLSFSTLLESMKIFQRFESWGKVLTLFASRNLARDYELGDKNIFIMAIEASEAGGNWQQVLEILKNDLLSEKPNPSPVVFEVAICALCNLHQEYQVMDVYEIMKKLSIIPTNRTYELISKCVPPSKKDQVQRDAMKHRV